MADALAHVVSAAGRVLEDRLALLRLEARRSVEHGLRVGRLRAAMLAAWTCAVGLGMAAVIWGLSQVMSVGFALGAVAAASGVTGVGVGLVARRIARERSPQREARPHALGPAMGSTALAERTRGGGSA